MGLGMQYTQLSDPRCVLLKKKAKELAKDKDRFEEFQLYENVERLGPEVFNELKKTNKPMCANVDFYSGFVYDMLNIPMDLYTSLFAIARVVGLCAHIIEEMVNNNRIIRPAYRNVGETKRYIPLEMRN